MYFQYVGLQTAAFLSTNVSISQHNIYTHQEQGYVFRL